MQIIVIAENEILDFVLKVVEESIINVHEAEISVRCVSQIDFECLFDLVNIVISNASYLHKLFNKNKQEFLMIFYGSHQRENILLLEIEIEDIY